MGDAELVEIQHSLENLKDHDLHKKLGQRSVRKDKMKQLPALCKVQNEAQRRWGIDNLIKPNDVWVFDSC